MNETFKIGEVAILVAVNLQLKNREGQEVILESGLLPNFMRSGKSGYRIRYPDGMWGRTIPKGLRKKKPPQDERQELGEWELCPWQPRQLEVRP